MSLAMAGMIGGMAGGVLTGGLQGGWKGALIGGLMGGALGGLGYILRIALSFDRTTVIIFGSSLVITYNRLNLK